MGNPRFWGTRSPQTPQSIELKFDTDDYVGGGTPHAKMVKVGTQGRPGKGVKYNVQITLCLGLLLFLLRVIARILVGRSVDFITAFDGLIDRLID